MALRDAGKYKDAEKLAKETLGRLRSSLGETHPLTLGTMSLDAAISESLAYSTARFPNEDKDDTGRRVARAARLHKEAVDGARVNFGLMHPLTSDIIYRYAKYLTRIREYGDGLKMATLILPAHIKHFGEDGRNTLELKEVINFLETKRDLMEAWALVGPDRKEKDSDVVKGLSLSLIHISEPTRPY